MIESRRIVEVLRLRKLAEATIAGRVSLIRGSQRIAFIASSLAIAAEEAKHIDRILDATTHLAVDANPLLWAPEFIERNARLVEAFVDAHARDLLAAYARIAAYERWRERWLAAGAAWHVGDAPPNWNGRAQLAAFLSHESPFDK